MSSIMHNSQQADEELKALRAKVEELNEQVIALAYGCDEKSEQLAAMTEERDKVFAELCALKAEQEEWSKHNATYNVETGVIEAFTPQGFYTANTNTPWNLVREAQAREAALRKDAERYRWLLHSARITDALWDALPPEFTEDERHINNAIDAAMKEAQS